MNWFNCQIKFESNVFNDVRCAFNNPTNEVVIDTTGHKTLLDKLNKRLKSGRAFREFQISHAGTHSTYSRFKIESFEALEYENCFECSYVGRNLCVGNG